jgi:hypothetical protein
MPWVVWEGVKASMTTSAITPEAADENDRRSDGSKEGCAD